MSQEKLKSLLQNPSLQMWMARLQPKQRTECRGGVRPCPHTMCMHHVYFRNPETGEPPPCHAGKEVWELADTCRLDIQEREQAAQAPPPTGEQDALRLFIPRKTPLPLHKD